MNRRNFIRNSTLTTLVLPAIILDGCDLNAKGSASFSDDFALDEATIGQLQEAMESGEYTSRKIVELYLERINAVDKVGGLNSVIEINPDALSIADQMDRERAEGKVRGPLHGIPVMVKDNIDTGDKMMTTAGSLALEGHRATQDAFIVRRLREAGAVLLGKTNLSEWANFRSTRSSSGWSSRGGQTKNPYVLDRNPCGSSSGSGVAVSANLCMVAIGTETNGSIACPSSINGVVGIKPTVGLLSRSGIIPISHTQDTAGPMARTVRDAAIALGVMTDLDPRDPATAASEGKAESDYTKYLDEHALQGKRIGVEKSFLEGHEDVTALYKAAIETMRQYGAELVEVDFREKVRGIGNEEYLVLQYEFKDGLNKYLSTVRGAVRSLKDVIAFNEQNEERAMPFFKQEILESSEAKGDLQTEEFVKALEKILSVTRKGIDGVLQEHQLNAICGPTNGPSWCTDLVNGDHFTGYGMYSPAAIAGYPHISVPMGLVDGLPVGLTFIGAAYSEGPLLAIAYAYEQSSKKRVPPSFKPTLLA